MASRAATFYPSATEQDFTATGELDIRKLSETIGPSDDTTLASFSGGQGEVILHPYASNNTLGTSDAPNYGWALNRDGTDGMAVPTPPAGVDSCVRFIAAGTWTFRGRLSVGSVVDGTYRLRVRVYKVDSTGARSLLFGPINSNTVSVTVAGVNVTASTSQSEITFAEDETLLVSYGIEQVTRGVTNLPISFELNDSMGNDCEIVLPAGIRTRYIDSESFSAVATSSLNPLSLDVSRQVNAVGTASMSRTVTASRTITVNGVGTVTRANAITKTPITVNGVGTVSGRIQIPLDEIPDDGDFSGSDPTAAITGTVYDEDQAIAVGATVLLFRQSDNLFIGSTITDAAGAYSFTRDTADPNEYYVVAFVSDTSHGSSNRSLAPG